MASNTKLVGDTIAVRVCALILFVCDSRDGLVPSIFISGGEKPARQTCRLYWTTINKTCIFVNDKNSAVEIEIRDWSARQQEKQWPLLGLRFNREPRGGWRIDQDAWLSTYSDALKALHVKL
jgi:hypothetical protein